MYYQHLYPADLQEKKKERKKKTCYLSELVHKI